MKTYQVGTTGDVVRLRKEINDQLRMMSLDIANLYGNNTIPVSLHNNLNVNSNTITGAAAAVNATDVPNLSQVNSLISAATIPLQDQYKVPWQLCGSFSLVGTLATVSATYLALSSAITLANPTTAGVSLILVTGIIGWHALASANYVIKVVGNPSSKNVALTTGRADAAFASGFVALGTAPTGSSGDTSVTVSVQQASGANQQIDVCVFYVYNQVGQ